MKFYFTTRNTITNLQESREFNILEFTDDVDLKFDRNTKDPNVYAYFQATEYKSHLEPTWFDSLSEMYDFLRSPNTNFKNSTCTLEFPSGYKFTLSNLSGINSDYNCAQNIFPDDTEKSKLYRQYFLLEFLQDK